jgi:protein phosphatase 2C family protein 2/3
MDSARQKQGGPEKSGSCAIVLLIVGDICYAVNVGDSRAVLSSN